MFDFFKFRSFFKDYDIDDRFKQYEYFIIKTCFLQKIAILSLAS